MIIVLTLSLQLEQELSKCKALRLVLYERLDFDYPCFKSAATCNEIHNPWLAMKHFRHCTSAEPGYIVLAPYFFGQSALSM